MRALYRTPLILLIDDIDAGSPPSQVQFKTAKGEFSQDPMARRAYDLGYHHAVRRQAVNPPSGYEQVYRSGFKAGIGRTQPRRAVDKPAKAVSRVRWSTKAGEGGELPPGHGELGSWISDPNMDPATLQKGMKQTAESARSALLSKGAQIGDFIGCGQNGCVYRSARPGHVIKVDRGDNEARLANAIIKNRDLQSLKSIPKYVGVHSTGVKDHLTGADVYAIEREDLDDLPDEVSYDPKATNTLDELSNSLKFIGDGIQNGTIADRKTYNQQIDATFHPNGDLMRRVSSLHGGIFGQGAQDIVHMLRRGLVPCDLHVLNWGKRKQTGDVVMRDLGCFATANHLK